MNKRKEAKYVGVESYKEGESLCNCYLVGWSNSSDWFDFISGEELFTRTDKIKTNNGFMIGISGNCCIYASDDFNTVEDYSKQAREEGYDVTTCKIEIDETGDYIVVKAAK